MAKSEKDVVLGLVKTLLQDLQVLSTGPELPTREKPSNDTQIVSQGYVAKKFVLPRPSSPPIRVMIPAAKMTPCKSNDNLVASNSVSQKSGIQKESIDNSDTKSIKEECKKAVFSNENLTITDGLGARMLQEKDMKYDNRMEVKIDTILSKLESLEMNQKSQVSRHKVEKQLQVLASLRTALYSTRKSTERMVNDTLDSFDVARNVLLSQLSQKSTTQTRDMTPNIDTRLESDIKDFSFLLERLRIDLTKGSRPDSQYEEYIQKQTESLQRRLDLHKENLSNLKHTKKQQWESTLSSILQEQQEMSQNCEQIEPLETCLLNSATLASSILPVLEFQRTHAVKLNKVDLSDQVLSADEAVDFGMNRVLLQLQQLDVNERDRNVEIVVDTTKRVQLGQINPFEQELVDFVNEGKLRDRGGITKIEKELSSKFVRLFHYNS